MTKLPNAVLLSGLLALGGWVGANAQDRYNQVDFEVNVQTQVANDEFVATLSKSYEHKNPKVLASTLNEAINQAMAIAKKYPKVQVSTAQTRSYPNYDSAGKMTGFMGSSSLLIKSQDFEQAAQFMADVQSFMTVDGLEFGVSKATKDSKDNGLKLALIAKLKQDANQITQAFGAKSYKFIKVQLNEGNNYHAPMMQAMSLSSHKVQPQQLQGGDSELIYRAIASIELVY